MVTVMDCGLDEFRENTRGMRIFCFGGGKYFRNFVSLYPDFPIAGVIDNYCRDDWILTESGKYPRYSVSKFCDICGGDCVIVITLRAFEEAVEQMDALKALDGVPCYLSVAIDESDQTETAQKAEWKSRIEALSERKNKGGSPVCQKEEKRIQIWEYFEKSNIGGSKARTDISTILSRQGYAIRKIHCTTQEQAGWQSRQARDDWEKAFASIAEGAVIFMQHPAPRETILPGRLFEQMKREKHVRFIVLVHEVESLRRKYDSPYRQSEFETMLSIGDVFIVHNDVMRQFYIDQGIEERRVISLGIFDYLDSRENVGKIFERSVTIAANLDLVKSPYLLKLKQLSSVKIHLYGPNYSEEITADADNIIYHGSLPTEVIPRRLDRGFGLVWDGDDIQTCSGGTGEYLKYNNPHKLSLYLSAGLPVIIWSQAAQAQFVREHKVGLGVDSLEELGEILEKMSEEQYESYVRNAEALSRKLKSGEFTKTALGRAEMQLNREEGDGK